MSGGIGETNIDKSRIEVHGVFVCVSMVVAVSNARHCCGSQSAFNFRPSCIGSARDWTRISSAYPALHDHNTFRNANWAGANLTALRIPRWLGFTPLLL